METSLTPSNLNVGLAKIIRVIFLRLFMRLQTPPVILLKLIQEMRQAKRRNTLSSPCLPQWGGSRVTPTEHELRWNNLGVLEKRLVNK